ncbi:hypothetical protein C8R46DRAFT_1233883 [Mycena filopes]|nr:hypothetical protein C8R46DRAFT_1233883 [Mycena filopes]
MTTDRDSPDLGDADLALLLANLDLSANAPGRPRTPLPVPQPPRERHTFPAMGSRGTRPAQTIYQVDSPTGRAFTSNWAAAGHATQGVANTSVRAVQRGAPKKKKKAGKQPAAGYAIFCGLRCGVFETWAETRPLVNGVKNCIFRGYPTMQEAHAAFAYATNQGWVRRADAPVLSGIPRLPEPIALHDTINALNNHENFDGLWYVVYRGIIPGVYRSHLESQLNTVGVRGALHESVQGLSAAIVKYTDAMARGETGVSSPPSYTDVFS